MVAEQWYDTQWGFVKCRNLSCCMASHDSGPFASGVQLFHFIKKKKKKVKMWLCYVNLGNQIIYPDHLAGN